MAEDGGRSIKAVGKSLEVVEALDRLGGAGVTDVAEAVDRHPSTVHAHLRSLREHGYVRKEGTTYRLSLRLLELGGRRRRSVPLYRHGWRELQAISHETGEIGNLAVEEDGEVVFLYTGEGEQAVHRKTATGKRRPMHCTALGKAILAELPRERVETILDGDLERYTARTITDREALLEDLEATRGRGYALDDEELNAGVQCIARVVRVDGEPAGAISLTGPKERFSDERYRDDLVQQLSETANVIEVNFRFAE